MGLELRPVGEVGVMAFDLAFKVLQRLIEGLFNVRSALLPSHDNPIGI